MALGVFIAEALKSLEGGADENGDRRRQEPRGRSRGRPRAEGVFGDEPLMCGPTTLLGKERQADAEDVLQDAWMDVYRRCAQRLQRGALLTLRSTIPSIGSSATAPVTLPSL
jgi:hypothetical protein